MATTSRGYPLPDEGQNVAEMIIEQRDVTLPMINADMQAVMDGVAGKADEGHGHSMNQIIGLVAALSAKMAANKTFAITDLTDVEGVSAAPDGYVLIKSGGKLIMMSAAAGLGAHSHSIAQVSGLETALGALAPMASPALTGNPTAPTQAAGDNSIRLANTAFVQAAIEALRGGVSAAFDTLAELAAGLGKRVAVDGDQSFSSAERAQARKNIGMELGYPFFHAVDQKTQNTTGGNSVAGAQQRTLNTVLFNEIAGVALAGNQFTLPAGTYWIEADIPCFTINGVHAFVATAAGTTPVFPWLSTGKQHQANANGVSMTLKISGRLVVDPGGGTYRLMHVFETALTGGLGTPTNVAAEVYAQVKVWKLA